MDIYLIHKKKIKIMLSFFIKKNIIFGIIFFLIMLICLSYYLISLLWNIKFKNDFLYFDKLNNSLESTFKEIFDNFIPIIRELDLYEKKLINCTNLDGFYKMNLPKLTDIKIPVIEDLIMNIINDKDLKKESINKFYKILNQDLCTAWATNTEKAMKYCTNFWSGILLKGMRQAVIYLGATIVNVLDELQSINDINSKTTLFNLMNNSAFFDYKVFHEVYLFRLYNSLKTIFLDFREEKLSAINKILMFILVVYLCIIIFLSISLIYFIEKYKDIFNSFLNFIEIIPEKYIKEDNNLYIIIIKYGKKFFT